MKHTVVVLLVLSGMVPGVVFGFSGHDYLSIKPPVTSAELFDTCNTTKLDPGEQISGLCAFWDEHVRFLESRLKTACSAAGENIYKTVDGVEGVAFRDRAGASRNRYLHNAPGLQYMQFVSPGLQRHYRVFEEISKGHNGESVRRTEALIKPEKRRGDRIEIQSTRLEALTLRYLVETDHLTSFEDQEMGFYGDKTTVTDTLTGEKLAERVVYFYVIKPHLVMTDGARLEYPGMQETRAKLAYLKPCDQYQPKLIGHETKYPLSSYEFVFRVLKPKPYTDKERHALFEIALGKENSRLNSCISTTMGPQITPSMLLFSRKRNDLVIKFKGHGDEYLCPSYFWGGASQNARFFFFDGTYWGREEIAKHAGSVFLDNKAVYASLLSISEPNEFQQALQAKDLSKVKQLILNGADVKSPVFDDVYIVPLLAGLDYYGDDRGTVHDVLKTAVLKGASVNALVDDEVHPLLYAITDDYKDTVELLLELGADSNQGDKKIFENIVFQRSDLNMIALLVRHGYVFDHGNPKFWEYIAGLSSSITKTKSPIAPRIYNALFPSNNVVELYDRASVDKSSVVRKRLRHIQDFKDGRLRLDSNVSVGPRSSSHGLVKPQSGNSKGFQLPKRVYDPSAQLHVIGIYEGGKSEPWWRKCQDLKQEKMRACHQKYAGSHTEQRVEVQLFGSEKPVVLGLMSYAPAFWVINNPGNIPIDGVVLGGYHGQRIFGVDNDVPVDVFTYESSSCSPCQIGQGHFYGYKAGSEELKNALSRLKSITGKTPKSFQGKYRQKTFVVMVK